MNKIRESFILAGLFLIVYLFCGCGQSLKNSKKEHLSSSDNIGRKPLIVISPVEQGEENHKIITADKFTISVETNGGRQAELFYQPVTESDRFIKLASLDSPNENEENLFQIEIQTPQDFNGEIWARVQYRDGQKRETERLEVAADLESGENNRQSPAGINKNSASNQSVDDNESQRADKKTGGKIQPAALQPGAGNIRITINVPAFLLTVWQGDKQVKTYYIGVGRKNFPIPAGMRKAEKIIINPDWIPPNSEWLRQSSEIEPYKKIPAGRTENPLGKTRIPLGDTYLLHEARSEADIGNLLSRGCLRVLRDDLFELIELIVKAGNIPFSSREIDEAKNDSKRRAINFNNPLSVDINYDSMVIENEILTIYPDVYDKKTNTEEELRAELEASRVDVSKTDSGTLKKIIEQVDNEHKYIVAIKDIRAGNALVKGKKEPLTPFQAKNRRKKDE